MSVQPFCFPYVPKARPPEIDDRLLQQLIVVADDLNNGNATLAEAEWLGACMPTLLRELQARRTVMPDQPTTQNIIQIGAR